MGEGAITGVPSSPPPGSVGSGGDLEGASRGAGDRASDATESALATSHAASGASLGMGSASFSGPEASGEGAPRIEVMRGRELREAGPVDGTKVGTLNVGDRFAARSHNSAETVEAAGPNLPGRASMSFSVAGDASPPPISSGEGLAMIPASGPVVEDIGSGGGLSASGARPSRRGRSGGTPISLNFSPVSSTAVAPGGSRSATAVPVSGVAPLAGRQSYVFDVHDVHNMGGSPSSLTIRNTGTGEVVSSIPLQPGDSRITADLPAGDYSVEAVSGMRPGTGPSPGADNLDNFRVDVFSTGGAGSAGPDIGGGGPSASP